MATKCKDLFDYGIQNERSDIRVHVCPVVQRVYVYPTEEGRRAIKSGNYPKLDGYQPGVNGRTAAGYVVPPFAIRRCVCIELNPKVWQAVDFQDGDSTSIKGAKAIQLVAQMIRNGVFPLPWSVEKMEDDPDFKMQVCGDDIIVAIGSSVVYIQVKCDFRGGAAELGGTGNLYLQTAERNPLKAK